MESPLISFRRRENLTQAQLAERIGVKPPAICKWESRRIPAERVVQVEQVTGVPRHLLRPDLYPKPKAARAAS
jgi:DNA-binding transcriptional regulator YdaS (Cro superfamily)